jgi:hypothetical protein
LNNDRKEQGNEMNDCPVDAEPRKANFEKRVVGVFVVEKLIALF